MRIVVGLLACAAGVSLALADEPPAAPASVPAAPAASAPAAAAAPSAAAAAVAPASAAQSDTAAAATTKPPVDKDVQHFMQEGFKPEMRHGRELYCRRETDLGSRLTPVKTCGTIDELRAMEQRTRDDLQQAQQRQTSSPGAPGPMGGH